MSFTIKRKNLRKVGLWAADSCSGVPYDPEENVTIQPSGYEIVENEK